MIIVAALCWWGATEFPQGAAWKVPAGVVGGILAWATFEYFLHRYLLHAAKTPVLRSLFWKALHAEHHGYKSMKDPDHHSVHLAVVLPIMAATVGAVWYFSTSGWGPALLGGWIVGYCLYEGFHWLFHTGNPEKGLGRIPYIRRIWDAHTVHHLKNLKMNYGFVTVFWDRVFRTYLEPDESGKA